MKERVGDEFEFDVQFLAQPVDAATMWHIPCINYTCRPT